MLKPNALQTRSLASSRRLETDLRQRLQLLNSDQLRLLVEGSSDDRLAMAWLAVLKRIQLTVELTRDLLLNKLEGSDQQREQTTRIKQKRLATLPNNTPVKKESRQIKRAKPSEAAIAAHLG